MKLKIDYKKYSILFVLAAMIILFTIANPNFLTVKNLFNIIAQNTYFVIAAVGMGLLMIGGGVDLALGFELSLIGVVTAALMTQQGWPVPAAIAAGIFLGAVNGAVNGFVVIKLRVLPLIATLATCSVFKGLSYLISNAKTIRDFPKGFQAISRAKLLGLPCDVWLMIAIVVLATFVLTKTYFGRYIFAVGSSENAARLAGIPTKLVQFSLYVICSILGAVAAVDMIAKANAVNSSFGDGVEFTCVTASVIGGVSFQGGEGRIWGIVAGIFIVQILQNGMQLAGWSTYAQYIVKGLILIGAVAFDEFQKIYSVRRALRAKEREV